jgi:hypothetical protein
MIYILNLHTFSGRTSALWLQARAQPLRKNKINFSRKRVHRVGSIRLRDNFHAYYTLHTSRSMRKKRIREVFKISTNFLYKFKMK